MTPSTFHPFLRLPYDLRFEIWNTAVASREPNHHGLHYVDVRRSSEGAVLLAFHHSQDGMGNGDNKSACMMDAGLWKASKESRHIMTQHSRAISRDKYHSWKRLMIRGNDDECKGFCLVDPSQDIFCIETSNFNTLHGDVNLWKIAVSGTSLAKQQNLSMVDNIALEFDPTWNINLPDTYYGLMEENSPGCFHVLFTIDTFTRRGNPRFGLLTKTPNGRGAPTVVQGSVFRG